MRIPQRTSTLIPVLWPRSQNIHPEEWRYARRHTGSSVLTDRESPVWPPRANNNSIPKPWQTWIHTSLHVNTPEAVTLHALRFVGVEHGVVEVSVVAEDGVIAPQPHADRVGLSSTERNAA